jgi:epoxyqueuosine reductase
VETDGLWAAVAAAAAAGGWTIRAAGIETLGLAVGRVRAAAEEAGFSPETVAHIAGDLAAAASDHLPDAATVVVGAVARPLTRATLTVGGAQRQVVVPPHYAGYHSVPDGLAEAVRAAVAPFGRRAARVEPPLKTLAAGTGLARYGRNNIAYVPGLGSYLQLGACVTDAPPPAGAAWTAPRALDRCDGCSVCVSACPTGAVRADRFVLDTTRCLTWVNEDHRPFPGWVEPAWHTCAVGCLRCQQACPENAGVELSVADAEVFDATETAAILAATPAPLLAAGTRDKLRRCGLDYDPRLIARNLRALVES